MKAKLLIVGALLASASSPVLAAPILWISDSNGNLATVDVATGAATVVGNSGVALTDIAFDAAGNLYGISFTTLYSVNSTTAAVTAIGSLGLNGANALVFGPSGTLYAAASNTTGLYSVNTSTGLATLLGSTGFASSGDLAFVGNSLFLSADTSPFDTLVGVNVGPVSGTAIGNLGVNDVFGMARAEDNVLYGVAGNSLYSVNTSTGAATFLRTYNYSGRGAAFGTSFFLEALPAIPEPETWAMLIAGFGLLGAAMRSRPSRSVRVNFS